MSGKKPTENKVNYLPYLFVLILILAIAVGINVINANPAPVVATPTVTPAVTEKPNLVLKPQENEVEAKRAFYGLNPEMFSNLPRPPDDFYMRKAQFFKNQVSVEKLGEKYWLQPEWYPNFEGGLAILQTAKDATGEVRRCCYNFYVGEYIVDIPKDEAGEINAIIFMRSTWGVHTYQGISLKSHYPETSTMVLSTFKDGSKTVNQSIDVVKKGITQITISPNELIILPSYSNWKIKETDDGITYIPQNPRFSKNWVTPITINFKIAGLPAGKYAVRIASAPPSDELAEDAAYLYGELYETGGYSGVISSTNSFTLYLDVK